MLENWCNLSLIDFYDYVKCIMKARETAMYFYVSRSFLLKSTDSFHSNQHSFHHLTISMIWLDLTLNLSNFLAFDLKSNWNWRSWYDIFCVISLKHVKSEIQTMCRFGLKFVTIYWIYSNIKDHTAYEIKISHSNSILSFDIRFTILS